MKKTLLLLTITLIMMKPSSAQDFPHHHIPITSREKDKATKFKMNSADYYLIKSANLQNTSWKLTSAGLAFGITGLLLHSSKDYSGGQMGIIVTNSGIGDLFMFTGAFLIVASIPVYLESIHYKKKGLAMTASLNIESIQDLYQSDLLVKYYPALKLHVHL